MGPFTNHLVLAYCLENYSTCDDSRRGPLDEPVSPRTSYRIFLRCTSLLPSNILLRLPSGNIQGDLVPKFCMHFCLPIPAKITDYHSRLDFNILTVTCAMYKARSFSLCKILNCLFRSASSSLHLIIPLINCFQALLNTFFRLSKEEASVTS
jgi:hypothetical protein